MTTTMTTPTIAHSRFNRNTPVRRGSKYTRVVTSVWTYDREKSVLTYGATVFRRQKSKMLEYGREVDLNDLLKSDKSKQSKQLKYPSVSNKGLDLWNKKVHRERATERFNNIPVRIKIITPVPLRNVSLSWFIAEKLIFKFGCCKDDENDRSDEFHGVVTVDEKFNRRFPYFLDYHDEYTPNVTESVSGTEDDEDKDEDDDTEYTGNSSTEEQDDNENEGEDETDNVKVYIKERVYTEENSNCGTFSWLLSSVVFFSVVTYAVTH